MSIDPHICQSCGAENDEVLSNCAYCGSQLGEAREIDTLSDLELLERCSEWLARFESITSDVTKLNQAKQMGQFENMPFFGKFTKMLGGSYSYSGTYAAVSKYLDQLEVRGQHNDSMSGKIREFRDRFEAAKKAETKTKKRFKKMIIGLVAVYVVLMVVAGGIWFVSENSTNEKSSESNLRSHLAELRATEMKINESIQDKNFDYALILVEGLMCTDPDCSDQQIAQFDEKRDRMRTAIERMTR